MEQLKAFDGGTCGASALTDVLGVAVTPAPTFPPVLDACCGSRMFWFDRKDTRATTEYLAVDVIADKGLECLP